MTQPAFSIVVPAFDEEHFLPKCLDAIHRAAEMLGEPVEIIVVDNMSHDHTPDIAREHGCRVIEVADKCLSIIRNRGAAEATGRLIAFIDADSVMSDNMLVEIQRAMQSGRFVGGGVVNVITDRMSVGIAFHLVAALPAVLVTRLSTVMFYTTPEAFRAIGGFDEKLYALEDADFAFRLRRYGRKRGLRYCNLWRARVTTSARKFDEFGDWFIFRRPDMVLKAFFNHRKTAHEIWYRRRR